MAVTNIGDILTPDIWAQYGVKATSEKSAFWTSGIVAAAQGISLPTGGGTINLPFFGDLTGDAEVLSDSASLTPGNITAAKQVAVVVGRGRAWGANDLAGVFSGADPVRAIVSLTSTYWARQNQVELIKTLTGAFAAASMSGLVHDVSAGGTEDARSFTAENFLDAAQLLGDSKTEIAAIAMHSATQTYLAKNDLITFIKPSDGSPDISLYMGKRVIIDDGLPVSTGTYTSYLFGPGAVAYSAAPIGAGAVESDRDILAGQDYLTMRMRFILHPQGLKWVGTPAGDFPTRTELATGTNWVRVWEPKQIRMVAFVHKLG